MLWGLYFAGTKACFIKRLSLLNKNLVHIVIMLYYLVLLLREKKNLWKITNIIVVYFLSSIFIFQIFFFFLIFVFSDFSSRLILTNGHFSDILCELKWNSRMENFVKFWNIMCGSYFVEKAKICKIHKI